jgi:hypothetical protein
VIGPRSRHWQLFESYYRPMLDARGRLWSLRDKRTFLRWDGQEWQRFAPPPSMEDLQLKQPAFYYWRHSRFYADNQDRGWLLSPRSIAICDFASGKWTEFPDFRAALVAQISPVSPGEGKPAHRQTFALDTTERQFWGPVFSTDGRIGLVDHRGEVSLYEDGQWVKWKLGVILGHEGQALNPALFFTPDGKFTVAAGYFESDGKFTSSIGDQVAQWHADTESWKRVYGAGITPPSSKVKADPDYLELPDGARLRGFGTNAAALDNHGVFWKWEHPSRLVKMVPGRTVPVLGPGGRNPYPHGGSINEVVVDPQGNAIVVQWPKQLFIPARFPAPLAQVRVDRIEDDTALLALGAEKASAWHRWRLDGGGWQPLTEAHELTLQSLPPGKHTVEVRAFNAELTPSAATAIVSFETTVSTEQQFANQLRDLASPDLDAREAAARKLKSQGPAVLSRLRETRPSVSSDVQWWIDAIIQHIERQPAA